MTDWSGLRHKPVSHTVGEWTQPHLTCWEGEWGRACFPKKSRGAGIRRWGGEAEKEDEFGERAVARVELNHRKLPKSSGPRE